MIDAQAPIDDWPELEDWAQDNRPQGDAVSVIDIERNALVTYPMETQVTDNCSVCGGNCMTVGDYVCWGACFRCIQPLLAVEDPS